MIDRRVKRTRYAIHQAFINLLKSYDLTEVTIQQIADEADINRATFYKHYEDKYALLNALENQEINNIRQYIKKFDISDFETLDAENIVKVFENGPKNIINIILNNIELYEVLFAMNRKSSLEDKLSETIELNLQQVLIDHKEINGMPFSYFHSYIAGAVISTIKFWVLDENRISGDQLAKNIYNMAFEGPYKQLINEIKH